mgnify:CR=1 FL=1
MRVKPKKNFKWAIDGKIVEQFIKDKEVNISEKDAISMIESNLVEHLSFSNQKAVESKELQNKAIEKKDLEVKKETKKRGRKKVG